MGLCQRPLHTSASCALAQLYRLQPCTTKNKDQARTTSSGKDWGIRGVQTGPGAIEFTRIFLAASSAEAPLVKVMMAPCSMQVGVRLLLEVLRASTLGDDASSPHTMPLMHCSMIISQ